MKHLVELELASDSPRTFLLECGSVPVATRSLQLRQSEVAEPIYVSTNEQSTKQRPQAIALKRSISWSLASSGFYAACQWGIIIVLARLGSEQVGQFAIGIAVTAPIMLFTNLHLRIVQATDASNRFNFNDYLGLRILSTATAILLITVIVILANYSQETNFIIMAIAFAKAIESFSDIYYGLLQRHERIDTIACSVSLRGASSLIMLTGVVYLTGSVIWGVLAMASAWLAVLVAFDIPRGTKVLDANFRKTCWPRFHFQSLYPLAWTAFPIGLIASIVSFEANIPRYYLDGILGASELGVFAAIAFMIVAANTVVNAIHQPVVPRLANMFSLCDYVGFRQLVLRLTVFGLLWGACGALVVAIFGRWGLGMVYGLEYSQHYEVFVLLMVAAAIRFGALAIGTAFRAMQCFWWQSVIHVPGVIAIAITCPLLIRRFGLIGAAYSILFVSTFEALIYGCLALKVFRNLGSQTSYPRLEG